MSNILSVDVDSTGEIITKSYNSMYKLMVNVPLGTFDIYPYYCFLYDSSTELFVLKNTPDTIVNNYENARLDLYKEEKIMESKKSLQKTLSTLPVTSIEGVSHILSNDQQDQTNALLAISTSQQVLASSGHALNTNYTLNNVVNLNGVILICSTAGTSDGTTAPVAPTSFSVEVLDGTVGWKLFGQLLSLSPTGIQFFTPNNILYLAGQANGYITTQRQLYAQIKADLAVITIDITGTAGTYPTYTDAVAALDAIVI